MDVLHYYGIFDMKIPTQCQKWVKAMKRGKSGEENTISSIKSEKCLSSPVETLFFTKLASEAGGISDTKDAVDIASDIVKDNDLTCRGKEVPNGRFKNLFRLVSVASLRHIVPNLLNRKAITDDELNILANSDDLDDNDDYDVLGESVSEYKGEIKSGGKLGAAWVAEGSDGGKSLGDVSTLVDRLGLRHYVDVKAFVACFYERRNLSVSLHVPRSLDGIDFGQFRLVGNCSADAGMTEPLSQGEVGLPEAVHRNCVLMPTKLGLIKR